LVFSAFTVFAFSIIDLQVIIFSYCIIAFHVCIISKSERLYIGILKLEQVSLKMTAYQIVSVGLFLAFLVIFSCFLSQKKHEIFWRPLKPLL
jgi:hypothetical protein